MGLIDEIFIWDLQPDCSADRPVTVCARAHVCVYVGVCGCGCGCLGVCVCVFVKNVHACMRVVCACICTRAGIRACLCLRVCM